ncbi:rna-directed dna polymerase from mobile element jockey-like [Limosa lapponica baueri]|uniref:Rna-directed dna polymerase from mobile element jockey-like n=1 Tax=Limosa lapponica baueri TaxID=1758121 RepID=A0A2I0TX56_LIMLA|nr:rna-directed dna polymerase from mobile element jockey-like [Limosa lapponica baueri]
MFSDDTKLRGAVISLEGRDDIQKNIKRLGEWAHGNFMKVNKAKLKVLNVGQGNPGYQYRLEDEWNDSSPAGKDLEIPVDEK